MAMVSINMEDRLKVYLEKLADEEHRSLTGQIIHIIEEWLERHESK